MPGTAGGRRTLGGLLSTDANTRARCVDGHVAGWQRCLLAQCGVGHTSALGLVRRPVAISGLLRWLPSGGVPRLLHAGRILCGKVHNNAYSQDSQEFGASAGAY